MAGNGVAGNVKLILFSAITDLSIPAFFWFSVEVDGEFASA